MDATVPADPHSPLRVSAPGRVCLFGEHQDYLGLPVIAAAIGLRIGVEAAPRADRLLAVSMPDTGERVEIVPAGEQVYAHHRDYLRSAVNVLRRRGMTWPRGFDVVMRGDIPINAGVSSSSAMVVMWLRFLLAAAEAGDGRQPASAEELARLAYEAEVTEFGDPGGMMDHYCAALGGVLWIDTHPPFAAERLDSAVGARPGGGCIAGLLGGIVLGHSHEPKATLETLASRRRDVSEGMARLRERFPTFDLASTPLAEVEPLLSALPAGPACRLRANLVNRDLTPRAKQALLAGDAAALGRLLLAHHAQLRDGLDLSTPKIERMMEAALGAGALGGKINGSGGGGCMFAYAPGREQEVAEAIRRAGGEPFIVQVDEGARLDSPGSPPRSR